MGKVEALFGLDAARKAQRDEQESRQPPKSGRRAKRHPGKGAKEKKTAAQPAGTVSSEVVNISAGGTSIAGRRVEQRLTVITPMQPPAGQSAPVHQFTLPPLPSTVPPRNHGTFISFALCVMLPLIFAAVYYGFIAANQYVAEFRFTVKDASPVTGALPAGLMALSGNLSGSGSENYLVADFLTSPAAVEELQKRVDVIQLYSKPEVDWWSRFNPAQPFERFMLYWRHMVSASYDPITGIAVASVRAFTPRDALHIANSLVSLSEELVNHIANRSHKDNVRFAEAEVERAQERLKGVQARMTEYRNRSGVINPSASVVASNATLVQTLQGNLAQLQTQLETFKRQNLDANAPVIVTLNNQIKSVREQLQITESAVGKNRDGTPLSSVMGEYEQLDLERQFAQAMVTSTMQALDQARANAAAQHLYITPYVRPSLPQSSVYPRRLLSIAGVGAVAFAIWLAGLLMIRSIRERFA